MTPLAVTLRTLREAAGLTQRGLAEKSGVHRGTLQNLEQSRVARPHREVIDALADALGVPPDKITTDVFDPEQPTRTVASARQTAPAPAEPEPAEPSAAPSNPALVALAAAVQAHDPTAEVALDDDGPAVAAWLSDGTLLYLRSKHNWLDYLRAAGAPAAVDLPDLVHPRRREQTPEAKRALSAALWG